MLYPSPSAIVLLNQSYEALTLIIMVPLPLFKIAALFVRHISKYGAVSTAPDAAARASCF